MKGTYVNITINRQRDDILTYYALWVAINKQRFRECYEREKSKREKTTNSSKSLLSSATPRFLTRLFREAL